MATVRYNHVDKTFPDGTQALADFDLDVADGEFMVLVGPSGCGKSTALRLLAGLEEVSGGEVLIDGRVVNEVPPQQRDVAMVFQNYALYPHMSVRRNLEFPLRMMGLKGEALASRVQEAARLLGLAELLERRPKQLSGGQRQRVAMGRAIVRDPKVFLMDEPLSNLDAQLRVQIRAEIAALQRRMGVTTVYVTHDQVEAMTLGDRVAVLEGGRLQQVDRPQALYDHPANVFVAGFIGSPGMNIFPGVLHRGEAGLAVEVGGHRFAVPATVVAEREGLMQHLDRPLQVGLRPEAFSLGQGAGDALFQVNTTAVESLGHECIVYFELPPQGGAPAGGFAARLPDHPGIAAGQVLDLAVDLSRLQFFDTAGQAIR